MTDYVHGGDSGPVLIVFTRLEPADTASVDIVGPFTTKEKAELWLARNEVLVAANAKQLDYEHAILQPMKPKQWIEETKAGLEDLED